MNPEYFSIDRLVKTELPPLPASVMRVSALLSDYNASQRAVAETISFDPVLSSRILRLANSPIHALHGSVTSLTTAVSTVGNAAISEMLLISGISDSFGRQILISAMGKQIWFHLIATGIAASEICRIAGMRGAEDAFMCGLLHDIGKLILLRADTDYYVSLMERAELEGSHLTELELSVLGFDHAELGARVAESWQLPDAICQIIRFHHRPSEATIGIAMAQMIEVADSLVKLKWDNSEMDDFFRSDSAIKFGLDAGRTEIIWETVSTRLTAVMDTFS